MNPGERQTARGGTRVEQASPNIESMAAPNARIALVTLNAKYIHASLGLRYLLANMARHGCADLRACTTLHE